MTCVGETVRVEDLKTTKAAAAYLTGVLAGGDPACLRRALWLVAKAQAGMEDSIFQVGASGSLISMFASTPGV